MTDHYAVVGNPVSHSLSPQIHAEFARQTGQDLDYVTLLAPLDAFSATVERFRDEGGRGVNVTLPFKLEAYRMADATSERAKYAQAANVLKFEGASVLGDNTDGIGLVRDIEANLGIAFAGRSVLLLGAGGAARGVLLPMLERKPEKLVIANRTPQKAHELCAMTGGSKSCAATGLAGLRGRRFDLVINATSAGVNDEMPDLPSEIFENCICAYDMMYGKVATPFMSFALTHGARRIADGLGMLVEQAAESFLIWRGLRPQTAPVLKVLRSS